VIILGPLLESREPTRLRSATSKNLQEFAYRCVCCVLLGRKSDRDLALPPTLAIFASLLCPSFSYVYVYMCMYVCLLLSHPTFRSPRSFADESSTARQCATSCVVLPRVLFSSGYLLLRKRVLSFLRADTLPFYMPLISILRLAVFLSL